MLILNQANWEELWQTVSQTPPADTVLDDFEEYLEIPNYLGWGYFREMELSPGV